MRLKSNLQKILDDKNMSIRQLAKETGIGFESLRRLAIDKTTQYQTHTIGKICEVLEITDLNDLLELIDEQEE